MVRAVVDRRYYCHDCKKEREKRVSVRLKVWKWPIPTMRLYAITHSVFGKRDRRYDCAYHSSKTSWYFRITCVIRIARHVFFIYIYQYNFVSPFHQFFYRPKIIKISWIVDNNRTPCDRYSLFPIFRKKWEKKCESLCS